MENRKIDWWGWVDMISLMAIWVLLAVACDRCTEFVFRNEEVHVCCGEYHARNCSRLKKCNGAIRVMKKSEAKAEGIEPCYMCAE